MRAHVLDRADRTVRIERVGRKGTILYRGDKAYAMRGVSWAWGRPAYPRSIWVWNFIPFVGPFLANYLFVRDTNVFIAEEIPSTLEPQSNMLVQSMTDEQAFALMTAHSEAMSIGRAETPILLIVAIIALAVAGLAVVVSLVR